MFMHHPISISALMASEAIDFNREEMEMRTVLSGVVFVDA
jgi:hypothetical protein